MVEILEVEAGEERDLSELLQHEIDHLDGVLAIDRVTDVKTIVTREEFEKRYRAGSPYAVSPSTLRRDVVCYVSCGEPALIFVVKRRRKQRLHNKLCFILALSLAVPKELRSAIGRSRLRGQGDREA